jgi:hypothetical protein
MSTRTTRTNHGTNGTRVPRYSSTSTPYFTCTYQRVLSTRACTGIVLVYVLASIECRNRVDGGPWYCVNCDHGIATKQNSTSFGSSCSLRGADFAPSQRWRQSPRSQDRHTCLSRWPGSSLQVRFAPQCWQCLRCKFHAGHKLCFGQLLFARFDLRCHRFPCIVTGACGMRPTSVRALRWYRWVRQGQVDAFLGGACVMPPKAMTMCSDN